MAKKGLGKGIDVLIPQAKEKTKSEKENIKTKEVIKEVVKEVIKEVDTIDINKIEPNKNQPRKSFDEDSIHELAESIKLRGIIQPLVVQKGEKGLYTIIAGERRWILHTLMKMEMLLWWMCLPKTPLKEVLLLMVKFMLVKKYLRKL